MFTLAMMLLAATTPLPSDHPISPAAVPAVVIAESVRILPDDYPWAAMRRRKQGCGIAQLVIDPEGIPTACNITASTRDPNLDAATCKVLMRTRYQPGRNARGEAAADLVVKQINWAINSSRRYCPRLAPTDDR